MDGRSWHAFGLNPGRGHRAQCRRELRQRRGTMIQDQLAFRTGQAELLVVAAFFQRTAGVV
jgi:hypothetical protein